MLPILFFMCFVFDLFSICSTDTYGDGILVWKINLNKPIAIYGNYI